MCKVTPKWCHINFAWDPLRSYFDEPQKKWNSTLIFILFLHRFCSLFVKFWFISCKIRAKKSYKPMCLVTTFNSCLHDMTWRESNVTSANQLFHLSVMSLTRNVTSTSIVHQCMNPRRSKIGSSKESVGECKYFQCNMITFFKNSSKPVREWLSEKSMQEKIPDIWWDWFPATKKKWGLVPVGYQSHWTVSPEIAFSRTVNQPVPLTQSVPLFSMEKVWSTVLLL